RATTPHTRANQFGTYFLPLQVSYAQLGLAIPVRGATPAQTVRACGTRAASDREISRLGGPCAARQLTDRARENRGERAVELHALGHRRVRGGAEIGAGSARSLERVLPVADGAGQGHGVGVEGAGDVPAH